MHRSAHAAVDACTGRREVYAPPAETVNSASIGLESNGFPVDPRMREPNNPACSPPYVLLGPRNRYPLLPHPTGVWSHSK